MAIPKLSVVIASDNTQRRTLECVAALRAQGPPGDVQIIVADCSSDGTAEALARQGTDVEVLRVPQRTTPAILLAKGLQRAQGEYVAVLESRVVPENGWVRATLDALKAPHSAVGGTVEFAGSRRLVEWAAYLCDYGQFARPRAAGVVHELPGNNCAFPRAWLARHTEYAQPAFWKTFFLWQMQEREGVRLISVPDMVVSYHREFSTLSSFLTRRFHHARCFGGMRRRQLSTAQRWTYTLLAPLLPALFVWRILKNLVPKQRRDMPLGRALPLIGLASIVWAAGEGVGYLWGEGASSAKAY